MSTDIDTQLAINTALNDLLRLILDADRQGDSYILPLAGIETILDKLIGSR